MNTPTTTNPGPRKPLHKGKALLFGGMALVLTLGLFYAVENWRGERAWNDFKTAYEAKGKSLDWNKLIPSEVPAEKNMFAVPEMKDFIKGEAPPKLVVRQTILVKGNQKSPKSGSPPEVKTNELVIARILLATTRSAESGETNTVSVEDAAEAAVAIEKRRGQWVAGAQGISIGSDALAKAAPLRILVRGDELPSTAQMSELLKGLTVRESGSNSLEVVLSEFRAAGEYLASSPSIEKEWAFLVDALQRPYARMPGDYSIPWKTPVPNYVKTRDTAQVLGQQAQACLLLGQPAEALRRLSLVNRLRTMLLAPPTGKPQTLVSVMINVALSGLYLAVVEDGIRLRAWGDPELAEIAKQVSDSDLAPMVIESLSAELVATTAALQKLPFSDLFNLDDGIKTAIYDYLPRGWVYQNMAAYGRLMEAQINALGVALPLIDPRTVAVASSDLETQLARSSPFVVVGRVAIPNSPRAIQTTARNATKLRLAEIACALERHHLANRNYPAELSKLVPQYMTRVPREIIGGGEMRYRRISDKAFLLYSVGWNEKDDQGLAGGNNAEEGDWVWGAR